MAWRWPSRRAARVCARRCTWGWLPSPCSGFEDGLPPVRDDTTPSATPELPNAQAASVQPGAPNDQRGRWPWPREVASGRPKDGAPPPSTTRPSRPRRRRCTRARSCGTSGQVPSACRSRARSGACTRPRPTRKRTARRRVRASCAHAGARARARLGSAACRCTTTRRARSACCSAGPPRKQRLDRSVLSERNILFPGAAPPEPNPSIWLPKAPPRRCSPSPARASPPSRAPPISFRAAVAPSCAPRARRQVEGCSEAAAATLAPSKPRAAD